MNTLLEVDDLWCSIGRRSIVRGVSLIVHPGEALLITGENGSGKTTLLNCLSGLLPADKGTIHAPAVTGFCPQEPLLWSYLTPREHFQLFGAAAGLNQGELEGRATKLFQRFAFEKDADKVVNQLSGGTRQKLNLSLALLAEPQLLFLDEPYSGFDVETYQRFLQWVNEAKESGRAIVAVAHLWLEKTPWDKVLKIRDGRIE